MNQNQESQETQVRAAEDRKKIDQLKGYKKHWEPRWYLALAFYEGAHFSKPQKDTNGNWIKMRRLSKGRVLREIPKAKKQLQSVRNLILKQKQRPVVYPDKQAISLSFDKSDGKTYEQACEAAAAQGRYLDHQLHEVMKLGRFKRKLVRYAGLYNVAYIQIMNDDGDRYFEVYDPFEISVFPTISNINDHNVVVKHITRRLSEIEDSEMYDREQVSILKQKQRDGQYSASKYKNSYMSERFGKAPDDSVVIDEMYEVVNVDVDEDDKYVSQEKLMPKLNDDGSIDEEYEVPKTQKKPRVRIRSYVDDVMLREEVTQLTKIPISMYVWDDEAYQTSFMEELMPLNKAYDIMVSKLEQKAKKMDTGRYAIHKSEDAKVMSTNDGEFIRYKRSAPTVMQEATVPNAFMETIGMIEGDLREQGVAMTSAAGIPKGVEAWRAIESLKEADYSSIGTQLDNLNETLTDITEKLTEMLAYDITDIQYVQLKDESGEMKTYRVIGKRGYDILMRDSNGASMDDVIVIDPDRDTKIEIESEMTWTEEGKRNLILDLLNAGALPKELALETLKYGNTQEVMEKLRDEASYGQSMIDTPDFKALPEPIQMQIIQFLKGNVSGGQPQGVVPQ
jgi:hypothetical protein